MSKKIEKQRQSGTSASRNQFLRASKDHATQQHHLVPNPPPYEVGVGLSHAVEAFGVRGQVSGPTRPRFHIAIYALICYCFHTNSIVPFPTPPGSGAGLGESPGHPGLSRLPAGGPAACRGPAPGYCAYRHWASRTRAVSLLTGDIPHYLPFI